MKAIKITSLAVFALLLVAACKKKNQPTPQEMLEGKWIIQSQEWLTYTVPGDGSYLQFNACSSSCSGVDYKASDTTSGTFTYVLNEEATLLTITDNSSDGGSWGAAWDILELTENDLRITGSTPFGNVKVEMTK